MKKILFVAATFICCLSLFAQDLYVPRNIQKAYKNGTRSKTGAPGASYWQNKGVYDIAVEVMPDKALVSGKEKIVYTNNSPDTLKQVVIRFVNNLHKPNSPRGGYVSDDFLSKGLTILSFSANGQKIDVDSKNWSTIGGVKLNKVLLPKSSVTFDIEWEYPLSKQSGREGQIDSTTFYCAYSYPRVSVYDDYNGWDVLPHSDRQEFYNDFNDYKLAVKAPKNYVVWATGDLQNIDEVLQPEIATRLKKSFTTNEIIHVATADEMKAGKVTAQQDWNTWKFAADHITDVCFALSNHYIWDASSTIVDSSTKRRASTQAAYDIKGTDFVNSVKYSNYALNWFSHHWPGVPYPFSKMTAFQGFADMEYPMMVNDSQTGMDAFGRFVQDHEIAHTYFPFYMGINETRYAYMDEGWATTLEYLIALSYLDKKTADANFIGFRVNRYIKDPSAEEDQPIISMSTQVSGLGYGNNSYGKAALSYLALKDYLGDDLFKKALHAYMNNWNGKHPIPWDFFYSFNTATGKNLNWFWQNWFFSNNYIDLKLKDVKHSGNKTTLTIENVGGFAIPFDVIITTTDGKETKQHFTPAVWEKNQKATSLAVNTTGNISSVKLDGNLFVDYTPDDNTLQL